GDQGLAKYAIGVEAKYKGICLVVVGVKDQGDVIAGRHSIVTLEGGNHKTVSTRFAMYRSIKEWIGIGHLQSAISPGFQTVLRKVLLELLNGLLLLPYGIVETSVDPDGLVRTLDVYGRRFSCRLVLCLGK